MGSNYSSFANKTIIDNGLQYVLLDKNTYITHDMCITDYSGMCNIYRANNLIYAGHLINGVKSGEGTEYFLKKKLKYVGNFKNGVYDGSGTLYHEDGDIIYSGQWTNGDWMNM
jgi:antitoxin component YwqK of YwqJK toxin-antitoxin module